MVFAALTLTFLKLMKVAEEEIPKQLFKRRKPVGMFVFCNYFLQ